MVVKKVPGPRKKVVPKYPEVKVKLSQFATSTKKAPKVKLYPKKRTDQEFQLGHPEGDEST